ncbi:MAG: cbb3-type cytochrome oxidase assembly protein CcoS [Chitinophagaceae bacterium]
MIKIIQRIDIDYNLPTAAKIHLPNFNTEGTMSVIIILMIASISVAAIFLAAFLWSVRSGQFEDDYSPSSRILFDDKPVSSSKKL